MIGFSSLDDEEEDQARQRQPRPDAKRHRLGLEHGLQRRRVGVEELQHDDRADPHRQIAVAEMGHRRQRRVDLEPAVQQIKDLTDADALTAAVRASGSDAPCDFIQKNAQSVRTSSNAPTKTTRHTPKAVEDRTIDHARRPQHHVESRAARTRSRGRARPRSPY